MKKLFRQEWKYYVVLLVAVMGCLYFLVKTDGKDLIRQIAGYQMMEESAYWIVTGLEIYINYIFFYRLTMVILLILLGIFILKICLNLSERGRYEREFFQTLPIKRTDRMCFHLLMDSLFLVISLTFYGGFCWWNTVQNLKTVGLELPWLGKAVFGMIITDICYLLFILGMINFLECIFVNGMTRLFGVAACMGMSGYILNWLLNRNKGSSMVQKLYGFFFMQTAGNNYYTQTAGSYFTPGVWEWYHDPLFPGIIYQGEVLLYRSEFGNPGQENVFTNEILFLSKLYDFSRPASYGLHILAYIGVALILAGISIWLFGKQELSRQGMYFAFGKYILGALLSMTFYIFMNTNSMGVWHTCLSLVAAVLIFLLVIYGLSPNKKYALHN